MLEVGSVEIIIFEEAAELTEELNGDDLRLTVEDSKDESEEENEEEREDEYGDENEVGKNEENLALFLSSLSIKTLLKFL